jgi:lysophospholipase L1-like esterase
MPFKIPVVAALLLGLLVPAAAQAKTNTTYYVNLGDSYAVGWQPSSATQAAATRHGYADQTVKLARKKGYRFTLVNFGCAGATTDSLLHQKGCKAKNRAIGAPKYKSTQIAAAEQFLRKHRGHVGLITVSISGNDVTSCAKQADPVACVGTTIPLVKRNVTTMAKGLRKAAGKKVPLVGTTYPDVILGQWVANPPNQDLAKLSVVAFQSLLNPGLEAAYAKAGGKLVDVTKATGAYTPLDQTTTLAPYGTIPAAVADVCTLTYYCQYGDIHSRTAGYGIIAKLIVGTLATKK